jgi:acyl carrier protein
MEREEIKQVVIELIHDKGFFGDEVTEETTLEDMAWDSLYYA